MSWDWADPIRERIFGAPLPGGCTLERVDEDTYWDLHEAELRAHFSPDVLFWADSLTAPTRRAARARHRLRGRRPPCRPLARARRGRRARGRVLGAPAQRREPT